MSQYATIDDLVKLLDPRVAASLANDTGGDADLDDPDVQLVLNAQLQSASATADGYLRAFHVTPLAGTPDPQLVRHVCEIAIHLLYARRPGEAENPRASMYADAMDWLKHVRAGTIKLEVAGETVRAADLRSTTEGVDPAFTRTSLEVLG